MPHTMPSREMLDCMKDCMECAGACAQTIHHCLHLGGEHASPEHQGLLRDCEEICGLAASFMSRSSHHAAEVCRQCATICAECADDCARLANGEQLMSRCAEICRKCSRSCERMAGVVV